MKAEKFYLVSPEVVRNAVARLLEIIPNGKVMMTLSDPGSKNSKQRGLQHIWYGDIAAAGIGGRLEDTKENVDLACKWKFAIPIFVRDDSFFSDLYDAWKIKHGGDQEAMRWFVEEQVHTENFSVSQMAEYLTCIQNHYSRVGVQLTDPQFRGLLLD
jgi:hypothetical protein